MQFSLGRLILLLAPEPGPACLEIPEREGRKPGVVEPGLRGIGCLPLFLSPADGPPNVSQAGQEENGHAGEYH